MTTEHADPEIDEVREARISISRACGNDARKLAAYVAGFEIPKEFAKLFPAHSPGEPNTSQTKSKRTRPATGVQDAD
jgi:hypothetical protein